MRRWCMAEQARSSGFGWWRGIGQIQMLAVVGLVLAIGAGAPVANAQTSAALKSEIESLQKRIEQLEGQLVDLQVVIGTLESLARNPNRGNAGTAAPSSGDDTRIAALETQVSALAAQVAQLARRAAPAGNAAPAGTPQLRRTQPSAPSFGQTTVREQSTSINGDPPRVASANPAQSSIGDPKDAYENAYGALLQQKYDAARIGFEKFLKAFPRHELAGNAQYWLGEVYFVRGDYKRAAKAFLAGYQQYGRSGKAADSLFKLAVSLDRLGQTNAACQAFGELATRFPNAPGYIKNRAAHEQTRLRCSR